MNKKIKGVWGNHWSHGKSSKVREMDNAGPELWRVVEEFEGLQNEFDELPHHQEGITSQRQFLCHVRDFINVCHVRDFINVFLMNANPFEELLRGLLSLGDKVCESPVPAHSVYSLESAGKEQFYTQGK